jgi:hypothetical protein
MRAWWNRASDLFGRWRAGRDQRRQAKYAVRDAREAEELQRTRDGVRYRGF